MEDYFGVKVAGWHDAFADAEGGVAYYHPEHAPDQSDCEHPVFPVFADETYEWQPVCSVCHQPLNVALSERALENAGLIPVGV